MTGFLENEVLRLEGLSEGDISALNAILPDLQKLDKALLDNWPTINKVVGVLLPMIHKVLSKQQELKS